LETFHILPSDKAKVRGIKQTLADLIWELNHDVGAQQMQEQGLNIFEGADEGQDQGVND